MTDLERRTWWLLRAYPPAWRRERGEDLVGTVVDLAAPGQRWPSPHTAADLVIGGWIERAHAHRRAAGGWFAAGRRTGMVVAVVLQVALAVALLVDFTDGVVPGLPVLGAASAVSFVAAMTGFLAAALAWVLRWARAARWLSVFALGAWVLTAGVFQIGLSGFTPAPHALIAWTFLAVLATRGLCRPSPAFPVVLVGFAGVVTFVALRAVVPVDEGGVAYALTGPLAPGGPLGASWVVPVWIVVALLSIVLAIRDPRGIIASSLLLPLVVVLRPPVTGVGAVGLAALAAAVLLGAVMGPRMADAR